VGGEGGRGGGGGGGGGGRGGGGGGGGEEEGEGRGGGGGMGGVMDRSGRSEENGEGCTKLEQDEVKAQQDDVITVEPCCHPLRALQLRISVGKIRRCLLAFLACPSRCALRHGCQGAGRMTVGCMQRPHVAAQAGSACMRSGAYEARGISPLLYFVVHQVFSRPAEEPGGSRLRCIA